MGQESIYKIACLDDGKQHMTSSPQIREQHVTLGEGGVTLRIFFKPGKKHFLIRLHGDETDASAVGQWWVETYGHSASLHPPMA